VGAEQAARLEAHLIGLGRAADRCRSSSSMTSPPRAASPTTSLRRYLHGHRLAVPLVILIAGLGLDVPLIARAGRGDIVAARGPQRHLKTSSPARSSRRQQFRRQDPRPTFNLRGCGRSRHRGGWRSAPASSASGFNPIVQPLGGRGHRAGEGLGWSDRLAFYLVPILASPRSPACSSRPVFRNSRRGGSSGT